MKVAAVQLRLEQDHVERNLRHAADVAAQAAREHSPGLLLLPAALGGPVMYSPRTAATVRPVDGEPYALLRRLAREHGCVAGGGFLARRGAQARSVYLLAEPDGATHLHDQDQPSMWEAAYVTGGADDGFCSTPVGPIGLAVGLEWLRSRTARRLRGLVRLVAGGACWWSAPSWAPAREHAYNVALAREAPARIARLVGAPAAIAQQVGDVAGRTPLAPGAPWRTTLAGETQIADRDGRVLERLSARDGEGYVAAEVSLAEPEPEPLDEVPDWLWLTPLPVGMQLAWRLQGLHGRLAYSRALRAGAFPWQSWPASDLHAYNPPELPPDERPERRVVAEPYGVGPDPP
ncbi:MAG: nitrilase-related carbon-nitrogen hydrolase [Thermoleophilaceae bacterium]